MPGCTTLTGIPLGCNDNNIGSINKMWIADYSDVDDYTLNVNEDTVDAITMATASSYFYEYGFTKNSSSYTENLLDGLDADTTLYEVSITLGLRRIEVAKRNAIALLAEGRRNLVIIIQDNNDELRIFGLDDGIRLQTMEAGTNETRDAGTFYTLNFIGQEKWLAYNFIDVATIPTA